MHLVSVKPETVFQALADPTRLRILRVLAVMGEECCLCELVDSLLEPPYKLSRHLKLLRQVGLLSTKREGRWAYHRLVANPVYLRHLHTAIRNLPDEKRVFAQDLKRFRERMRLRENGRCRIGIRASLFATAS